MAVAPTWPWHAGCCFSAATTACLVSGRARLDDALACDDPTQEIGAAWGVKQQLRLVLKATTLTQARTAQAAFDQYVTGAQMVETTRLKNTIDTWWPRIKVSITTRASNAKTEAANVTIRYIKRTGGGTARQRTTDPGPCSTTPHGSRREHPHHVENRRPAVPATRRLPGTGSARPFAANWRASRRSWWLVPMVSPGGI